MCIKADTSLFIKVLLISYSQVIVPAYAGHRQDIIKYFYIIDNLYYARRSLLKTGIISL